MKNILLVSGLISASLLTTGCAPKLGGSDYTAHSVGEISQTLKGTVISARPIMINAHDDSQFGVGAGIGGVSGALLGSQIGGGKGSMVAGVLGGLLGAGAGHLAHGKLTEQQGVEYMVQTHNADPKVPGQTLTISQGAEPPIAVGQSVIIIKSNQGRNRIIPG